MNYKHEHPLGCNNCQGGFNLSGLDTNLEKTYTWVGLIAAGLSILVMLKTWPTKKRKLDREVRKLGKMDEEADIEFIVKELEKELEEEKKNKKHLSGSEEIIIYRKEHDPHTNGWTHTRAEKISLLALDYLIKNSPGYEAEMMVASDDPQKRLALYFIIFKDQDHSYENAEFFDVLNEYKNFTTEDIFDFLNL